MAGNPRLTAGKIALTFVAGLYGAVVIGSGLDRLSNQSPALERLVPGPLRAAAERAAARQAAARGQPSRLLSHARAAVKADPVDPGSTSLLGMAWLLKGDNKAAEQAFRVAARFGWRDIPTQAYWYEAALEAGEVEPAADRLDALLRARPDLPGSDALLIRLENTPSGRRALERRLAQRPGWLNSYLQVGGKPAAVLDRRAAVLADLAARGTRLGCANVTGFVTAALAAGARRQAEQVWVAHCPGASVGDGLADASFQRVGSDQMSPFGWQVRSSGDVTLEPITGPGGKRTLRLANSASVSRLILVQAVALEPGRYRLSASVPPGHVAVSLGCNAEPLLPSGLEGDIGSKGQLIEVPRCDRLSLGIWLRPSTQPSELGPLSLQRVD